MRKYGNGRISNRNSYGRSKTDNNRMDRRAQEAETIVGTSIKYRLFLLCSVNYSLISSTQGEVCTPVPPLSHTLSTNATFDLLPAQTIQSLPSLEEMFAWSLHK